MTHDPFADQMLAAPLFVGYVIFKAWRPLLADLGCVIVACLLLAVTARLVTSLERWIGDRVSAYWQQHHAQQDSEQLWREFDQAGHDQFLTDTHDGHTQVMPGVTQLGPTVPLPTLPTHKLQRRRVPRVRIPGRRDRRHTTTSDRRH